MKHLLISLIFLTGFFLAACSDDGGGDGPGDEGPQGITYSGNESPAEIGSGNATVLTNRVLNSESAGEFTLPLAGSGSVGTSSGPAVQYWAGLVRSVVAQAETVGEVSADGTAERRQVAVTFNNETENCSGGGNVTLDGTLNDVDFTGTLTVTFNNCIEEGITNDGETTFDIDIFNDDMVDITVSFTRLNLTGPDFDITQTGTVRVQLFMGNNYDVITLNVVIEDSAGGELFMCDEFVVTHQYDDFDFPSNVMLSWDGRLFHSVHGYVDVETIVPFCYTNTITDVPDCGGEILLTGDGNATLRVTAVSNEQVRLELDEDGDGTVDITRTMTWEQLAEEIDIALE